MRLLKLAGKKKRGYHYRRLLDWVRLRRDLERKQARIRAVVWRRRSRSCTAARSSARQGDVMRSWSGPNIHTIVARPSGFGGLCAVGPSLLIIMHTTSIFLLVPQDRWEMWACSRMPSGVSFSQKSFLLCKACYLYGLVEENPAWSCISNFLCSNALNKICCLTSLVILTQLQVKIKSYLGRNCSQRCKYWVSQVMCPPMPTLQEFWIFSYLPSLCSAAV